MLIQPLFGLYSFFWLCLSYLNGESALKYWLCTPSITWKCNIISEPLNMVSRYCIPIKDDEIWQIYLISVLQGHILTYVIILKWGCIIQFTMVSHHLMWECSRIAFSFLIWYNFSYSFCHSKWSPYSNYCILMKNLMQQLLNLNVSICRYWRIQLLVPKREGSSFVEARHSMRERERESFTIILLIFIEYYEA